MQDDREHNRCAHKGIKYTQSAERLNKCGFCLKKTGCQVWSFQPDIAALLSAAWFLLHVQIHVFISNKASSHCDKFCCCSDALIRSLAGCQLHQQTALSVGLLFLFLSLFLSLSWRQTTSSLPSLCGCHRLSLLFSTRLALPHLIPCFLHTPFHYRPQYRVTRARCLFCNVLFF